MSHSRSFFGANGGRGARGISSHRTARVVIFAAVVAALSLPLHAHDFWIAPATFEPAVDSTVRVQLRVGENFDGDVVPRNESAIEAFVVATADGSQPIAGQQGRDPAGLFRVTAPGTMLIAYRSRPSSVELPAAKFEQYLTEEGLEHVIEARARRGQQAAPGREQFSRSVKALLHAGGVVSGGHDRVLGLTLELVPERDPAALAAGARLPIRLLYEGRPLPGALIVAFVRADGSTHETVANAAHSRQPFRARSDEHGRVEVPVGPGVWLIKAVHMVPAPPTSEVDWQSVWASLTFHVPTSAGAHLGARRAPRAADASW